MTHKLTQTERRGMAGVYNLTDGHAHHNPAPYQPILDRLPELFSECLERRQEDLEVEFEASFFKSSGQASFSRMARPLYQYACSLSIEVAANYLHFNDLDVTLIHPTFDNLADILRRNQVGLHSIDQDWFTQLDERADEVQTDALFLVCPNNPTGQNLSRQQFEKVVEFCARRNKLLIIDFSFRFYSDFVGWDQYAMLLDSGIDFIALEDTGKTWPTLEMKVGMTVANDRVYSELLDINDDMTLNVSPFAIKLLNEFIQIDSQRDGQFHPQAVVDHNRRTLRRLLADAPLEIAEQDSRISVEWLRLPPGWIASELCSWLTQRDVHVLPGMPFFWDDRALGEPFVRLSLARPRGAFERSAQRFSELLSEFTPAKQVAVS